MRSFHKPSTATMDLQPLASQAGWQVLCGYSSFCLNLSILVMKLSAVSLKLLETPPTNFGPNVSFVTFRSLISASISCFNSAHPRLFLFISYMRHRSSAVLSPSVSLSEAGAVSSLHFRLNLWPTSGLCFKNFLKVFTRSSSKKAWWNLSKNLTPDVLKCVKPHCNPQLWQQWTATHAAAQTYAPSPIDE